MATVKSVTVALRTGVSDATLPNNIRLTSGKTVALSLEDWGRISRTARDTVLTATFNTAATIVPLADSKTAATSDYVMNLTDLNNFTTIALLNADTHASRTFALGDVVRGFNDAAFKLVKVDSSSSTVATGSVVMWGGVATRPAAGKAAAVVTSDTSDITDFTAPAETVQFAGVSTGTITAGRFGWIQIAGTVEAVKVEANVAAGDAVGISKTTDERLTSVENEVQTLTLTSYDSSDTIKLTWDSHESSAVTAPQATAAGFQAAIDEVGALSTTYTGYKAGDCVVTRTSGSVFVFTFSGASVKAKDISAITATSGTGSATGVVVETNKGATGYGTVGSATSDASSNLADVMIRSGLARSLRSRSTNLFRNMR